MTAPSGWRHMRTNDLYTWLAAHTDDDDYDDVLGEIRDRESCADPRVAQASGNARGEDPS